MFDSDGTPQVDEVANWDASGILTGVNQRGPDPTSDNRKIYTSKIENDKSLVTIEFKWNNLSSDQKTALNASATDAKKDGLGEKRVDYLRGGRNLEQAKSGGIFRTRSGVLGDIINSNIVYVGAPAPNVQGPGYQKYYEANKARLNAVYVGANDGMLHAFDADSGRELFAYIPHVLVPALNQLTRPGYVHRPYVDGSSAVSDAMVAGAWKTVLVSGMGGGAQGVFALDVTNPADFGNAAGALWEFTDADDADMGNQLAAPVIAKFKISSANGKPEYKYFVVVTSGLNNYKADGAGRYDASGAGTLFLLSLDKSPTEKWKHKVNYFKFTTPIKNAALQNGLSAPALVMGGNGAVRYVYAGDLQGNLWRFDFTGDMPWSHARRSDSPIFTATDDRGNTQPITTQPKIVFAPGGGYVVLFGTGKFIEEVDAMPTGFKVQSFYGVYDTTTDQNLAKGRKQLALRTLVKNLDGDLKVTGDHFNYGLSAGNKQGWYVDFQDSEHTGERSITNPIVASGKLFFNTLLPSLKKCDEGSGRSYAVDALSGLSPGGGIVSHMSQIGVLGVPLIFQTRTGQVDNPSPDNAKVNADIKKKLVIVNVGAGGALGIMEKPKAGASDVNNLTAGSRRFGWREIQNWQELHNAVKNR